MVSTEFRGAGRSPYTSAPSLAMTAAERAAWAYFAPLAADKKAVWIDPSSSRFYRYLGASDAPASAKLLDRCGDRIFTVESSLNRHPIIVTDSITSRPVLMFGAGGTSPNALSATANGVMVCADGVDGYGVGDNNPSVWLPSVGFSAAWKARLPAPSATVNGVAFGSQTGGSIFGQAVTADADSFASVGFKLTTGYANIRTRDASGSVLNGGSDRRDGLWHDYVATYNPQTTTLRLWQDGVAVTPDTSASVDVSTSTGAGKIMLGAGGRSTGGPGERFIGFMAFACWMQGPVLEDANARAAVRALMATR